MLNFSTIGVFFFSRGWPFGLTLISRNSRMLAGACAGVFLGLSASAAELTDAAKSDLLASYVKVSAALAADDFATAKTSAAKVAEQAGQSEQTALGAEAAKVASAPDIETARAAFKDLSTAIEPFAAGQKNYAVMYCPMVKADWVQAKGKTQNPYYGTAMLTCGAPKKSK